MTMTPFDGLTPVCERAGRRRRFTLPDSAQRVVRFIPHFPLEFQQPELRIASERPDQAGNFGGFLCVCFSGGSDPAPNSGALPRDSTGT